MLTISAQKFNQLSPAAQLDALRDTSTKRKARTSYEREVARIEAHQKRRDAMIADALTFCPNFLDGAPLQAAA